MFEIGLSVGLVFEAVHLVSLRLASDLVQVQMYS